MISLHFLIEEIRERSKNNKLKAIFLAIAAILFDLIIVTGTWFLACVSMTKLFNIVFPFSWGQGALVFWLSTIIARIIMYLLRMAIKGDK